MKKFMIIALALLTAGVSSVSGQEKETGKQKEKQDQSELVNDVFVSAGTGTVYYFIDNDGFSANSMSGTFLAGFSRSITKVFAVGFQFSYAQIARSGMDYNYYYDPYYTQTNYKVNQTDNLWQGIATVRFHYLHMPGFSMYSGVGMGVTMDYYRQTADTINAPVSKGQKILPAGQLTLLGFRVGRALSFFGEFGIGTNSILSAGVSYKFKD